MLIVTSALDGRALHYLRYVLDDGAVGEAFSWRQNDAVLMQMHLLCKNMVVGCVSPLCQ